MPARQLMVNGRGTKLTLINLDDILPNNSTSTNVQVTTLSTTSYQERDDIPDLGVTHQSLFETDSKTMSV